VPRVEIREIRGDQLELWETRLARGTKKGAQAIHFRAAAIVEAAYVPAEGPKEGPPPGEKIFERDDIKRLAREGGAVLIRLYAAFRRVHGLDEGEDEDPEKNLSEGGQD